MQPQEVAAIRLEWQHEQHAPARPLLGMSDNGVWSVWGAVGPSCGLTAARPVPPTSKWDPATNGPLRPDWDELPWSMLACCGAAWRAGGPALNEALHAPVIQKPHPGVKYVTD